MKFYLIFVLLFALNIKANDSVEKEILSIEKNINIDREKIKNTEGDFQEYFKNHAFSGHNFEVIPDGNTLAWRRLGLIESAAKSIYLSAFIFETNIFPRQVGYLLCEKAKKGVDVRLLLDAFGGKDFYEAYADMLRDCGVGVLLYNPGHWGLSKFHWVIHEKLLIVDGKTVMLGGNGFDDAYHDYPNAKKYYRDMDIKVEGDAACFFQKKFMSNWKATIKKDLKSRSSMSWIMQERLWGSEDLVDCQISNSTSQTGMAMPVYNNPYFSKDRPIFESYKRAIKSSGKEIKLYAPYFVPHDGMVASLLDALERGVKVTIMTNSIHSNDETTTLIGMLYKIGKLLKSGIEIRLYNGPRTMHRKGGVFDGKWAYFGSDNQDVRGHSYQSEAIIFTDDQAVVEKFQLEFQSDYENSILMDQNQMIKIYKQNGKIKNWLIKKILKKYL